MTTNWSPGARAPSWGFDHLPADVRVDRKLCWKERLLTWGAGRVPPFPQPALQGYLELHPLCLHPCHHQPAGIAPRRRQECKGGDTWPGLSARSCMRRQGGNRDGQPALRRLGSPEGRGFSCSATPSAPAPLLPVVWPQLFPALEHTVLQTSSKAQLWTWNSIRTGTETRRRRTNEVGVLHAMCVGLQVALSRWPLEKKLRDTSCPANFEVSSPQNWFLPFSLGLSSVAVPSWALTKHVSPLNRSRYDVMYACVYAYVYVCVSLFVHVYLCMHLHVVCVGIHVIYIYI